MKTLSRVGIDRRIVVIPALLALMPLAHAANESLFASNTGQITGDSCAQVQSAAQAIIDWSTRLHEQPGPMPQCTCTPNSIWGPTQCTANVYELLPRLAKQLIGVNPRNSGPNCANSVLVIGQIIPELRYTNESEINFWIHSPLCRELKVDENPSPGDIINLSDHQGNFVHSYTYLAPHLRFQKTGISTSYQLATDQGFFDGFVDSEHPNCRKPIGTTPEQCPHYEQDFSCKTLSDYLSERNFHSSADFQKHDSAVCQEEHRLREMIFNDDYHHPVNGGYVVKVPKELKDSINQTLDALNSYAESELKKPHPEDETFLWKSLLVRIDSAKEQLNHLF